MTTRPVLVGADRLGLYHPAKSIDSEPVVYRFFLVLAVIALFVGAFFLTGATSIMPWENHYGEPMGCWNEATQHELIMRNQLEAYATLYCK